MSENTLSGQPRQGYGDPRERAKNFVKVFSYKGESISFFVKDGAVYLNATEMAKVNPSKKLSHWGSYKDTFILLDALNRVSGKGPSEVVEGEARIPASLSISKLAEMFPDLVKVVRGGLGKQGTWLHEDVAMDFSRWVSPEFSIWCNDRLKELFGFGATFTQEKLEELLISPDTIIKLATQVKEAREEIARYQDIIVENEPKVKFAEAIEVSEDSLKVGELAKVLKQNNIDVGRNRLFKVLRDSKYLCSHKGEFNNPTQMSMNLGLFEVNVHPYTDLLGNTKISKSTVVTGKGIEYFVTRFKEGKIAV